MLGPVVSPPGWRLLADRPAQARLREALDTAEFGLPHPTPSVNLQAGYGRAAVVNVRETPAI
jgi:hypothetical protein